MVDMAEEVQVINVVMEEGVDMAEAMAEDVA